MFKVIITDAVISRGFDGAAALRFSEGDSQFVRFRIGKRKYDKSAPDNYRWLNIGVKAFGGVCERIRSMKLDAGSYVNIIANYDEEAWEDKETGERRSAPVLIVDEIEYCFSGTKNETSGGAKNAAPDASAQKQTQPNPTGNQELPDGFTGYAAFGGKNPFFGEDE